MKPLVSILICAYNAEDTIAETLRSAIAQTWSRKEIIVLNDGSTDRTAEVVRGFKEATLVSTENQGFSSAQNHAFDLSQGDYIQYLDADDLLAPDKIERQLGALREGESRRMLLSSPWAPFYYRTGTPALFAIPFVRTLSPDRVALAKNGRRHPHAKRHLAGEPGTGHGSRTLGRAPGYDQDGEFFCRVLLASEGTRFVAGTGIYYRSSGPNRISLIGKSDKKRDSLFLSMKLHIQYLRSLEDSERVREACLAYLQIWYPNFYPERPDIMAELQGLAGQLHGRLVEPRLRWKYAWLRKILGYQTAKRAQSYFPQLKGALMRRWDNALFRLHS